MKFIIKRAAILAYCHGLIDMAATSRLFARFNLRSA